MLTEEVHSSTIGIGVGAAAPVADGKVVEHEQAAHDARNWVRLTFDCNDHCIFCLDSDAHNGQMRDNDEVKRQILDGRKKGATRLILSGGEPTIHPRYVDFIKLGRLAGYAKIQTVTNGRMFRYREFLTRCVDAGLGEITFSLHGPNAKVHDALVGTKGAFDEEIQGLTNALDDGRLIVNIDVVINRANVKFLPEMLEKYIGMGVKEFDLLQVVPFGRAFTDGRDTLFYDLEEARPYLLQAFEYSRRPDVHIWLNRFPPPHLEGFEHLIQDPYKLNDEVRGRKEEFARLLDLGIDLDCREPERCRYCYLEKLCDTLYGVKADVEARRFEVVRVDTEWEAHQPPVFGGDPASARRGRAEVAPRGKGMVRLPLYGQGPGQGLAAARGPASPVSIEQRIREAGVDTVLVCAPTVARALEATARYESVSRVELELSSYEGFGAALDSEGRFGGKRLDRVTATTVAEAQTLLGAPGQFEVLVDLDRRTAPWLLGLGQAPARLALRQPTHERLTESAEGDVDLRDFFARFRHPVPVENVPTCVLGRPPRERRPALDTAMMTPDGRLEIFRYTKRFILEHYWTKSLRCKDCAHTSGCRGMHVNYVRAHGYALMQPVLASTTTDTGTAAAAE